MRLEQNLEGTITVRDDQGKVVYCDTADNFKLDGGVLPALPAGMVGFDFCTSEGILRFYDAKHNCFPVEGELPKEEWPTVGLDPAPIVAACEARCAAAKEKEQAAAAEKVATDFDAVRIAEPVNRAFRAVS